MKVVVLAGGLGTRLAEETTIRPKPMVEIGGRPILWHIMKHYEHFGFSEFIVALGYKGEVIKQFFQNYRLFSCDLTVDLACGTIDVHGYQAEPWKVHLVETGSNTMTGGRIRRLASWLEGETFLVTYGDGVADVDLGALVEFHRRQGVIATITAVRPPARFGGIEFDGDLVARFTEKPQTGEGWINGGYLVLEPEVFSYLKDDGASLEQNLLERLAREGRLAAYRHRGFWQCMDTLRDKNLLEAMWGDGDAPWKLWDG